MESGRNSKIFQHHSRQNQTTSHLHRQTTNRKTFKITHLDRNKRTTFQNTENDRKDYDTSIGDICILNEERGKRMLETRVKL